MSALGHGEMSVRTVRYGRSRVRRSQDSWPRRRSEKEGERGRKKSKKSRRKGGEEEGREGVIDGSGTRLIGCRIALCSFYKIC